MRLNSLIACPKSHRYEWQSWYQNPSLLIRSQVELSNIIVPQNVQYCFI